MTHIPQHPAWQQALKTVITDPTELLTLLDLNPALLSEAKQAAKGFSLRVPREFVARMQRGNVHDPLLRQVLPLGAELLEAPGYDFDPLAESQANPVPGLLHKYHGRVLLTVAGGCAINCRYCFRRHFPYEANNPGRQGWSQVIDYVANEPSIHEVIFSGGDPLIATDGYLQELALAFNAIPHVHTLRIHTRLPIVIPARVTQSFCDWLSALRLQPVVVIHCNHANEIDSEVHDAMRQLKAAGITLLNQSVLLKDVNDNAACLIALSEKLFSVGVLPYYLHMLDQVHGTAHFAVDETKAKQLHQQLAAALPGYLVPRLVREKAHATNKTLMA